MSLWWKVGFNWRNCFVVILSRIKVVWLLFVELLFDMLICPKIILHLRHSIEILGPHARIISAHYFIAHCSWSVMFLTFESTRLLPCTTRFKRFFILHTGILLDLYSSTTYLPRQAGRYDQCTRTYAHAHPLAVSQTFCHFQRFFLLTAVELRGWVAVHWNLVPMQKRSLGVCQF